MKWFNLILFFTGLFLLSACSVINFNNTASDKEAPIVSGVEDITIIIGTEFDPFTDVVSIDLVDGDVSSLLTVDGNVDTSKLGIYFLKYFATDKSGNTVEYVRYVTVSIDYDMAVNMVSNGEFTQGLNGWTTTYIPGSGSANIYVVGEELKVEILTVLQEGLWAPRIEYKGITFEAGKRYEVSFDARSLEPRSIHVQIGELLPSDPWFIDFQPTNFKIHDLSNEMSTYTFTFRMDLSTNHNGAILFELGTVVGSVGVDHLITTVFIDNVRIIEIG